MLCLDIIRVLSGSDAAMRKWAPLECGCSWRGNLALCPFGLHEMSCFVPPHAQLCTLMLLLLKGSTLHSQATVHWDTSANTDQISLAWTAYLRCLSHWIIQRVICDAYFITIKLYKVQLKHFISLDMGLLRWLAWESPWNTRLRNWDLSLSPEPT